MGFGNARHVSSFNQDGTIIQVMFDDGVFCHFSLPDKGEKQRNIAELNKFNLLNPEHIR
jgi:hypothetical protein